jgi:hypothetical protein
VVAASGNPELGLRGRPEHKKLGLDQLDDLAPAGF